MHFLGGIIIYSHIPEEHATFNQNKEEESCNEELNNVITNEKFCPGLE